MKTFSELYKNYDFASVAKQIESSDEALVKSALSKANTGENLDLNDFAALVSPAASKHLEEMAQISHQLTKKRFGNTIQLFAPLYLSNECQNICTYCGFSYDNKLPRKTLAEQEIAKEIEILKAQGFDHVLIVTGESSKAVGMEYFLKVMPQLKESFSHISFEVQPLDTNEYKELSEAGVDAVLVYQETYDQQAYKLHHPKGKKSNFFYRLETPDRLGEAGVDKIGLGALTGLSNWRADAFFVALHLKYLTERYWRSRYSIAFPRLQPAEGVDIDIYPNNERDLAQLVCAYRLFDHYVELSLSTRESQSFRDHALKLGVTTMSAGSKTDPGGYANKNENLEQFEISDERSPEEVVQVIKQNGYEPVWKDWSEIY